MVARPTTGMFHVSECMNQLLTIDPEICVTLVLLAGDLRSVGATLSVNVDQLRDQGSMQYLSNQPCYSLTQSIFLICIRQRLYKI